MRACTSLRVSGFCHTLIGILSQTGQPFERPARMGMIKSYRILAEPLINEFLDGRRHGRRCSRSDQFAGQELAAEYNVKVWLGLSSGSRRDARQDPIQRDLPDWAFLSTRRSHSILNLSRAVQLGGLSWPSSVSRVSTDTSPRSQSLLLEE